MSTHPPAEQLSAFLDQELPEAVRLAIEEHLRACDACAAHLSDLASVDEAARALPLEEPAGYFDDFAARVRGRIAARPTRKALPVWTWAAAAAVLLAVVTPLAWRERAAQSPEPAVLKDQAPPPPAGAAPAALPPVSAAKPQAPPSQAAGTRTDEAERRSASTHDFRANQAEGQNRLLRRDRAVQTAPELQLSEDKREQAPAQPEAAAPPPERLEEKAVDRTRTFGEAPAARSQRPHGPLGQQQFTPPPPPAAAPATADREAAAAAEEVVGTDDGFRDADLAKEKADGFARQKRAAAPAESDAATGGAAPGGAVEAGKLGATTSVLKAAPPPAATGDEARQRRETFRQIALQDPRGTAADEARVGTIEQGVRAFLLERRPEDRATAERDGKAYLARRDALQKPRVRALLQELEGIR